MVILGIDPGLATIGFGVIDAKNSFDLKMIDYGVIETPKNDTLPTRLKKIYDSVVYLIKKFKPDAVAIEELFFTNNIKTGITVAEARGVCVLAAKENCDNIFEYTPLQIKQALTGQGRAEKEQVEFMVMQMLNLRCIPKPDDAADALAVAITHSQTNQILGQNQIR